MLDGLRKLIGFLPAERIENPPRLLDTADIVDRLRAPVSRVSHLYMRDFPDGHSEGPFCPLRNEAADEIEWLREELAASRHTDTKSGEPER